LAKCENANLAKQDKAANDDVSQEIIRIAPCVVMPSFFLANVNLNLDRTSKCVLKKEEVFEIKDILFQNQVIAHPYTNKLHTNSWLLLMLLL